MLGKQGRLQLESLDCFDKSLASDAEVLPELMVAFGRGDCRIDNADMRNGRSAFGCGGDQARETA